MPSTVLRTFVASHILEKIMMKILENSISSESEKGGTSDETRMWYRVAISRFLGVSMS